MKLQKIFIALATVLFASAGFAQYNTPTDTTVDGRSTATRYSSSAGEAGWFPSINLAFGHVEQTGNADADGEGLTALLVGTYYFADTPWVADAGVGFHKQYLSGEEDQPIVGAISASGRYEFANRVSIGPVADAFIGTSNDFGTENRWLTMVGIIGFKEIAFTNDSLARFGVKYSTEAGIEDQTSNYLGLVFQWGIGSENSVIQRSTAMNE